jgi:hypothetical protein
MIEVPKHHRGPSFDRDVPTEADDRLESRLLVTALDIAHAECYGVTFDHAPLVLFLA